MLAVHCGLLGVLLMRLVTWHQMILLGRSLTQK
jgi:hypothetical protein